jgi:CBS domain-containing protein
MSATEYQLSAGDLMTMDPVVVAVDAPIEEAERLILDHGVSGLPVVDRDGDVLGVVSQTDFMHLADPDVRSLIHHKASGIRVGEIMSRPPVTVGVSTPLVEAARRMVSERVHRVVVVDDEQRPLGVLSAMDFVTLFAERQSGR